MQGQKLPVAQHFEEIRFRVIFILISLFIFSVFFMFFAPTIIEILKLPAGTYVSKLAYFSPEEPLLIYAKVGLVCGLILTFPVIIYNIWAFVKPAVSANLSKVGALFIAASTAVFFGGCLFSYFILLPNTLKFISGFTSANLYPVISASKYITFTLMLIIGCGLVFELPVLSYLLSRAGVINHKFLRKKFAYAVFFIFIVSAVITPTGDALNMALLALPMVILYEVSIWVSYFCDKRKINTEGYYYE